MTDVIDSPPVVDAADEELESMMNDLKVKRKKKKDAAAAAAPASSASASAKPARGEKLAVMDKDLYAKLLGRIYDQLRKNNPDLLNPSRAYLRAPAVARVGTTRILWTNFDETCTMMKRDTEHVTRFFLTELGTTGSINGSAQFLIKGKFVPKYIESLLKKYINEYVTCSMCRGVDTKLARDPNTRMYFMTCESCGSKRSVAPIQKGFLATSRGERRAARNN